MSDCPACSEPLLEVSRMGDRFHRYTCLDSECPIMEVNSGPTKLDITNGGDAGAPSSPS